MSENERADLEGSAPEDESGISRRGFMGAAASVAALGGTGTTSSPDTHNDDPFWPNVDEETGVERTGLESEAFAHIFSNGFSYDLSHTRQETGEWVVESHQDFDDIYLTLDGDLGDKGGFELGGALSPDDAEQLGASLFAHAHAVRRSDE